MIKHNTHTQGFTNSLSQNIINRDLDATFGNYQQSTSPSQEAAYFGEVVFEENIFDEYSGHTSTLQSKQADTNSTSNETNMLN